MNSKPDGVGYRTLEEAIIDHYLEYARLLRKKIPAKEVHGVAAQLLIVQKLHELSERFDIPDLSAEDLTDDYSDWVQIMPEGVNQESNLEPSDGPFSLGPK